VKIVLKPTARRDVRTIPRYSRQMWGEAQRNAYRRALDEAFETLATYPLVGQAREDLRPGLRSLPVRQHLIFYRVGPQTVMVIRKLQAQMDLLCTSTNDLPRPAERRSHLPGHPFLLNPNGLAYASSVNRESNDCAAGPNHSLRSCGRAS
jgi:toxin ParE1/3/4